MHTLEKILDVMYTTAYMWEYSMQHGNEIYIVKERKANHGWMENGKEIYSVKERKAYHHWMKNGKNIFYFSKKASLADWVGKQVKNAGPQ